MKKRSLFLVVICFALVAAGCSKSAGTKLYLEEIHNQNVGNAQMGEGNQVVKSLPTVESFFVGDKSLMKNDEDVYPEDEMEQTK